MKYNSNTRCAVPCLFRGPLREIYAGRVALPFGRFALSTGLVNGALPNQPGLYILPAPTRLSVALGKENSSRREKDWRGPKSMNFNGDEIQSATCKSFAQLPLHSL